MSIVVCEKCDRYIDSDFDIDCFVEVGNMRRLYTQIVLCEPCRDKFYEEIERRANIEPETNGVSK